MNANAFRILVVDDEPAAIWSLSNFLKLVGYDVLQAGSGPQALTAIDYYLPHFVIASWEMAEMSGVELCRRIRARNLPEYTYVLLLTQTADSNALMEALRAGADDFLARPLVYGELLSRLRAGARMAEYESRLRRLMRNDLSTGIGSRLVFDETVSRRLTEAARRRNTLSCVLADVDFFGRINYLFGQAAGDAALKVIAERLRDQCEHDDQIFRVCGNRFVLLHEGTSEADAATWADHCRRAISGAEISLGEQSVKVTASFGVAALAPEATAEDALRAAEEPLLVAKQSGRNRVVGASKINELTTGRGGAGQGADPLRSAVARDIMTSIVVSFSQHETLEAAVEFLQACKMSALPVVDADGQLLGVVSDREIKEHLAAPSLTTRTVGEILAPDAPCYEEETTVQTLFEFFQRHEANRAEIVHGGRPTGYVTRGSLAALGKPILFDSFASNLPAMNRSEFLLVPDLAAVEGAEDAD